MAYSYAQAKGMVSNPQVWAPGGTLGTDPATWAEVQATAARGYDLPPSAGIVRQMPTPSTPQVGTHSDPVTPPPPTSTPTPTPTPPPAPTDTQPPPAAAPTAGKGDAPPTGASPVLDVPPPPSMGWVTSGIGAMNPNLGKPVQRPSMQALASSGGKGAY